MTTVLQSFMALSTLFGFLGCGSASTLEEGTFEGKPYTFSSREYKGFSTNSFEYSIKLGSLPAIGITASTTDWGPPYSDAVYGTAPFGYITQNRQPYRNELFDDAHPTNTMLYLAPNRFSKPEFDQYVRFMQQEWPAIDTKYATQPGLRSFPHLIGLVYGKQADFVRIFKGKTQGKPFLFRVEIDGRIRYREDAEYNNDAYTGLAQKVHMPGALIYLDTYTRYEPSVFTIPQLQQFRDNSGKTIMDYFTIVPKPTGE